MALGICTKIEDGFKWLGNNVLKPIVNAVAPVIDTFKPGVGTVLQTGINALTNLTTGNGRQAVKDFVNNPKIRLRGYG